MSTPERLAYRHPELGFTIDLPAGTEYRDGLADIALIALEPDRDESPFRANVTVVAEETVLETGLDAHCDATIAMQGHRLAGFLLLDREMARLTGHEACRTLAHHHANGLALAIEQWHLLAKGLAYTLTASCWALDYDNLADGFREIAESFEPGWGRV